MQSIRKRTLLALSLLQAIWIGGCANPAMPGAGFALNSVQGSVVTPTQNPQVARYTIVPPSRATVTIDFGTDTTYGLQTWAVPAPLDGGPVSILVAGMRAFKTYHMRARMNLPDGSQSFDSDHVFNTGGLPPERIPQVTVTRPDGLEPSPGIELIDVVSQVPIPSTEKVTASAFDLDGNLVWFYDLEDAGELDSPFPIKLLPNGDFLLVVTGAFDGVREINLAGETISQFSVGDVNQALAQAGFQIGLASLHHDILPLPNGHLILLGNTFKMIANLPKLPGATQVLGDVLIDLDQSRKPVWVWSTFDHLDINHQPLGFPDWTHANALIDSPDDGNLILSLRNQDWVVKINYRDGAGDGSVLWRLGAGGDFVIPGGSPADFNYAQHYPVLTAAKSSGVFPLMLFDNGNGRILDSNGAVCGSPGAESCYSRPVLFQLDETSKTAQILWQDKLPVYSSCCGSINTLENGDAEFDIAFAPVQPSGSRIQEVTQDSVPRLVWQMDVIGQLAYRAFRMPSLYPRFYPRILPPRPPHPKR
ncbi:MAG TPA: aryl-sulfate sulfotransferase [Candidatus Acidoferrum sp.]|nr:aryl-sulfate sulfotransferase [Candidatus Acidoferrum sp.]